MALWVRFPQSADVDAWAQRSPEQGVVWFPGKRYAFDGQSKPFARLCFAALSEREIQEAVRRMAGARTGMAPL
jgi:DNA-binding transcriptional MocR family regulator